MRDIRTAPQEAAEDLFFGQVVIIWARWFVILAGTILVLWTTTNEAELVVSILPVLALIAMNFFLHGRYLIEQPANRAMVVVASFIDLSVISLIVLLWPGQGGLDNQFFVLYYPIVLAFAFVFPQQITTIYTVVVLVAYAGASFLANPFCLATARDQTILAMRLITIAAMGGLGTYYWRIQRARRRAAIQSPAR